MNHKNRSFVSPIFVFIINNISANENNYPADQTKLLELRLKSLQPSNKKLPELDNSMNKH